MTDETQQSSHTGGGEIVRVVYVGKNAAKQIKNRLENDGMLCRDFRMTSVDVNNGAPLVAVPIVHDVTYETRLVQEEEGVVQGFGSHFCPYSSARLGNQGHCRRRRNQADDGDDKRLTLVQTGLLVAISNFLADNETCKDKDNDDDRILCAVQQQQQQATIGRLWCRFVPFGSKMFRSGAFLNPYFLKRRIMTNL
jgi:hypothetical protein